MTLRWEIAMMRFLATAAAVILSTAPACTAADVFLCDTLGGAVVVIDEDTGETRFRLITRDHPRAVVVDVKRSLVYAANTGWYVGSENAEPGTVTIFDLTAVSAGSPSGAMLAEGVPKGAPVREVQVGKSPRGLAMSPSEPLLFVTNQGSDTVSIVDTEREVVVGEVGVGHVPQGIAHLDGRLYIANHESDSISVVDVSAREVIAVIPARPGPKAVVVNPKTRRAYVTSSDDSSVSLLDMDGLALGTTVALAERPTEALLTPNGSDLLVSGRDGSVFLLDGTSMQVRSTMRAPEPLASLAGDALRGAPFAIGFSKGAVLRLDLEALEVVETTERRPSANAGEKAL